MEDSSEEEEVVEEELLEEVVEVLPQDANDTATIAAQIEARIIFFIGDFPFFTGVFFTCFLSFLSFDSHIIKLARKL